MTSVTISIQKKHCERIYRVCVWVAERQAEVGEQEERRPAKPKD
jgi:hypothetical protein